MTSESEKTGGPARELTIGSKRDCDLVFKRPTVSGYHARIAWEPRNRLWLIEDLGSTNGTFVRGARLAVGMPVPVRLGEVIFLGKTFHFVLGQDILELARPVELPPDLESMDEPEAEPEAQADDTPSVDAVGVKEVIRGEKTLVGLEAPQLTLELPFELLRKVSQTGDGRGHTGLATVGAPDNLPADAISISIGYSDDNAVQIKNPAVSGHHARLYRDREEFVLEDQGSTNGTWFGGERINRVRVKSGDQFSVGHHTLNVSDLVQYFPQQGAGARSAVSDLQLPWERPVRIGRDPQCEVRLDAPMVSGFHASIRAISQGQYRVEDLGSTNGTFVNSRENRIPSATVSARDVLFLGSYRLPVSRLELLIARLTGEHEVVIPPDKEVMLVGRDEACDIVLGSPQVSRTHAELRRMPDGSFQLRDLSSINGTFVNGQRIKVASVSATDLLSFANYSMRLDISAGVVRRDYHGDIMLQADRVTVQVPEKRSPNHTKTILSDVSFTVYPTEFVGLMGSSGAGKTTLMMALNGYAPPTSGRSLINGHDLYSNYNSYRGNIGYVPQDDIIFHELTVFESLYYTAKLRLPPDTTEAEIHHKIDDILVKLEIQNTRDVIIGDALKKGISGGERKRVNLAQELITEPSLLFLDEPTSGLASQDAINVMNLLRKLANEGRTILLTIHQPSLEAYRKMDNVIYLFRGRLVYYGPAYPDGISFFYPSVPLGTPQGNLLLSDPGNALKALADDQHQALKSEDSEQALDEAVEHRHQEYLDSDHYKDYVYDRSVASRDRVRLAIGSKQKTQRRGWLKQWGILTRRCLTIKRKDVVNTAILLLQAPIIGSLLWLVFAGRMNTYFDSLKRGPAALFLLVMSAVWFGCSNSAREIVKEQAIYRRERMVNLMIGSYVLSKFTVLGALCAVQCAILLAMVYPALGYEGNPLLTYGLMFLVSLSGVGMGLTLSSVVRSSEAATALVPLLLIPQIILGGILIPNHQLNLPMHALSTVMVARWGFEGLLHVEYGDDDLETLRGRCGIDACPDPLSTSTRGGDSGDDGRAQINGAFGRLTDQNYLPLGDGEDEDLCNVLCTNARRGTEVTPLERTFGLDLSRPDSLRGLYHEEFDVGVEGTQSGPLTIALVLVALNLLLFGLICSILLIKDVEVG